MTIDQRQRVIGLRLQRARQNAKLSLTELANKIDMQTTCKGDTDSCVEFLELLEAGEIDIPLQLMTGLHETIGVTIGDLTANLNVDELPGE